MTGCGRACRVGASPTTSDCGGTLQMFGILAVLSKLNEFQYPGTPKPPCPSDDVWAGFAQEGIVGKACKHLAVAALMEPVSSTMLTGCCMCLSLRGRAARVNRAIECAGG